MPLPDLVSASRLAFAVAVSVPVKTVLAEERPMLTVRAVVLVEELTSEPAPESEPKAWSLPLMSKIAPDAMTRGVRKGRTLAAPALKVPALTRVEPP